MTPGECIIDNIDISTLGIFIERGGSDDLLSYPERRRPDQNDWSEEDGLDVDLKDISFEAKKVTINYVMIAANYSLFKQYLKTFETLHVQPGLRQIYINEYGVTFLLRYIQFANYSHKGGYYNHTRKLAKFSVEYMMDDPLQLYTTAINSPVGVPKANQYLSVNGKDLSKYGIIVKDVYSSALKPRSAKDVLIRKNGLVSGQTPDIQAEIKRKSKEITIECAMLANTKNELLINLNALFNEFRKDTPINLKLAYESLYCYYVKSSQFSKPIPFSRRVRLDYILHFQEVSWQELVRYLAAQNGYRIVTQTGQVIVII